MRVTKMDLAIILTSSRYWDGEKKPSKLVKMYTLAELNDMYDILKLMEG